QINAVICDAALREIVGTDSLGPVARANLSAPLCRSLGVAFGALGIVELAAQIIERFRFVLVLRSLFLHEHHDSTRNVCNAARRFGLVEVLAAGALRPHFMDLQAGMVDMDIDIPDFGENSDSGG